MSKTAFYFKTVDEFNKVFHFIQEINTETKKKYNMNHYHTVIRVYSRYVSDPSLRQEAHSSSTVVPKRIPSKKKYVGVISDNKHLILRAGIDPKEILKKLNIELVGHDPGTPKYVGEKTSMSTYIKNYKQFRKIVSIFNKRFGHGNWRIQGPKKLQKKLLANEKESNFFAQPDNSKKDYKGIKVTIVVNEPNAAIDKLLFKIALMI